MLITLKQSTSKYFLFLILSFGCKVFAHEHSDDLQKLGAADGLSQGMIYQITQDRNGFIWVGTKNGLNRFDGFRFHVIDSTADGMSISNLTITCQFEDKHGRIWIGTEGEGLFVLERENGMVYHCLPIEKSVVMPSHILQIKADGAGNVWLAAFKGVYKIDLNALENSTIDAGKRKVSITQVYSANGYCRAIHFANKKVYWAEEDRLLLASEKDPFLYEDLTAEWSKDFINGSGRIEHIHTDSKGNLSLIRSHAISRMFANKVKHHYFNVPISFSKLGFTPETDSSFLISAHHLMRVSFKNNSNLKIDTLTQLQGLYARTISIDRTGIIWLGTNGYGILKFNPCKMQMGHMAKGLSFQNIAKINRQRVLAWHNQFLWEIDFNNRQLKISNDIPQALLTARNAINDDNGKLWFHFPHQDRSPTVVSWDPVAKTVDSILLKVKPFYISPMYLDSGHFLWMSSGDGVLVRINLLSKQVQHFDLKPMVPVISRSLLVNSILREKSGKYWLGTTAGLFEFQIRAESIQQLKYHPVTDDQTNPVYVYEITADGKNPDILWLSTRGLGFIRFHKSKGVLNTYSTKNGLPDNVVYGALPHENEWWVSTNKGLAIVNPEKDAIRVFRKDEGLQDDEFNSKALLKVTDSLLIFGGINGLNLINPYLSYDNPHPPKVAITGIQIFDKAILPYPIVSGTEHPNKVFHHDQNFLNIEFAVLDFRAPNQNRFQYYLQGGENKWIDLENKCQIVLSNLSPGKYTFRLRGSNNSGVWSEEEAVFSFTIKPPWWLSMPAMFVYFFMVGGIGFTFYKYQISRVQLSNKLAYEQKEAERLQELDRLKSIFFSNITHEFKTPITLILEPIRQLIKRKPSPKDLETLQLAERNSQKLLKLVNQLLDLSKLDEGRMKIEASEGDLIVWLKEIASDYKSWAAQKQIRFETYFPYEEILAMFDHQKLELILANLLSNAFKFSPEGGKILWKVEAIRGADDFDIKMQVSDEGPGIPKNEHERIFDRFHQVENEVNKAGGGTGIGLSLAKELTQLLGGTISVESEPGKGATFQLQFQLKAAATPETQQQSATLAEAPLPSVRQKTAAKVLNNDVETLPHVLVIEDNAELAQFISSILSPYYQVDIAYNGREGLDAALEHLPDLIISDVMMPHKDGFEVCEELKSNWLSSHIPIILLTAKSTLEHKITGLKTGADDYLSKPFYTEELLARIENLLAGRKLLQAKFSQAETKSNQIIEPSSNTELNEQEQKFLQQLHAFILKHLDQENFSVEDIASPLFVSRVQLFRKLKAITGLSPTEYIRNVRLDEAKKLLESGKLNVNEVIIQTGFGSRQYFAKAFKAKYGMLPSDIGKGQ